MKLCTSLCVWKTCAERFQLPRSKSKKLKSTYSLFQEIKLFQGYYNYFNVQNMSSVEIEVRRYVEELCNINVIIRWILTSFSELQFQQKSFPSPPYQNISKFQIFSNASLKAAVLTKSTARVNPVSPLLPWQTVQRQDRVYFFVSSQTASPFILERDWKAEKCDLLTEMFGNLFFFPLKPLEGCWFSEAPS